MTVTYKVHVMLKHVPEYVNHYEVPDKGKGKFRTVKIYNSD